MEDEDVKLCFRRYFIVFHFLLSPKANDKINNNSDSFQPRMTLRSESRVTRKHAQDTS